jgi:hypothetical protein
MAAARPATTRPRPARGGCGRTLLGLALTLGVLLVLVAAAWALVIRPPLHARADDAIGARLDGAVGALPAVEADDLQATGSRITITDAQVDAVLAHDLPQGMGIDRLTVSFAPGVVLLHYSAGGWGGTISTSPQVRGGNLVATQTHVTGILGWVESGPELEATANRSLAGLRAKTPAGFQMVSASQGALSVALNT